MNDHNSTVHGGNVLCLPNQNKLRAELPARRVEPPRNKRPDLTATLLQARARFDEVALLVLRIAEFRELAESFGDACCRQLECEVRARLGGCLRDSDGVFTLDGGEFAIVLSQQGGTECLDQICTRLVEACSGQYRLDEVAPIVNAGIGIALFPLDTGDVDDLIRYARIALRRAEAGGNEGFCYFSNEMLARQRYKIWMEGELERALVEQRFILHFQPQYRLDSHEIAGMEALVRLVDEDGELIPPDDFIAIAEDNGFIVQLGHWVIGEACRQLSQWRRGGSDLRRIAVNVSARQLLDEQLAHVIDHAVASNGLQHADLELEITESCILENLPEAADILRGLRDKGVQIAIDDFGAGYSSFATLAHLPIDVFKMDRAFMANVGEDTRARQVVTAMIAMARELGYQVVAEGVETARQHRFLRGSGCDLAQGFGLSRPQDANAVGSLLAFAGSAALAG